MDLGAETEIERVCAYIGLGTGSYLLEFSADGAEWTDPLRIEQTDPWGPLEWRAAMLSSRVRLARITVEEPGLAIGELALYGPERRLVEPEAVTAAEAGWHAHPLFDEQSLAVSTPDRRTGTYFDEVYFARAGLEIARGNGDPETSHPPLAKLLTAAAVFVFGPCPFAWRLFSALAGAASVSIFFLLARRLLGRTWPAAAAGLVFCLDFLRFTMSRICTPDTLVLFFTLTAFLGVHKALTDSKPLAGFLLAGICLGAGAACKWSSLYAAPAMLVLFALSARDIRDRNRAAVPAGLVCLTVLPAAVYACAYLPFLSGGFGAADFLRRQAEMFAYHSGMEQAHPFASPWWQWPFAIRPVWLYEGLAGLAPGMARSIAAMGNPLTWWPAAVSLPALAVAGVRRRDRASLFAVIAFASLYLVWAAAPRKLTFIYHYLPCLPFALIALTRAAGMLFERFPRARPAGFAFLGLSAASFALFFPVLWGIAVPAAYARLLTWLPQWTFWR